MQSERRDAIASEAIIREPTALTVTVVDKGGGAGESVNAPPPINPPVDLTPPQAHQYVKNASFRAAELAKPALITGLCWLRAALHSPEEPQSRLASFQGRHHSRVRPAQRRPFFAPFNT